jgi:glucan phosphoethanolaminetransferase (alkaline phosphatase superfamily)
MNKKERSRLNTARGKKLDKKTYLIITGLVLLNLLCNFLEPKIIGHNSKYSLYFFTVPVAVGILFFAYIFRKLLFQEYKECKLLGDKILVPCFFLLMGLFFSYLTFGLAGDLTWVYLNKRAAKENQTEVVTCSVNKLESSYRGRGAKMYFTFQNRQENFSISNMMFREYKDSAAKNYQLKIKGRKGIWNYFIVDSYELEETGK